MPSTAGISAASFSHLAKLCGLVVAVAVTAVTMIILGFTVLAPILELRERLAAAGNDLEHADRHSIPVKRRDELGDVLGDFNRLLGHVALSIAELRRSHAEVRASEARDSPSDRRIAEVSVPSAPRTSSLRWTSACSRAIVAPE